MRIAITINTSWNIYNFRSGLIKSLISKGNHVIAIAPKDEFSEKLINELGCEYYPIRMENTGSNPFNDLNLYRQLKKAYKKTKVDIALQYTVKPNIFGTLAAKNVGIPVINNVSGLGTVFLNKGFSSSIAKWLYKIAFRKADLIFFQNPDDRKDFLNEIHLPNLKTDLLPGSGVSLSYYEPSDLPGETPFKFLMISRLIIDKGVGEYIEAAEIIKTTHPDVEFQLLGEIDENHARGVMKSYLDSKIEQGIIRYLGTSQDVRKEIREADCVVLPSYREGTPKTLLEAAAMSRPSLTTDVPGCKEVVIEGENGFLCEVRNAQSLSDTMKKMLLLSKEERNEMGQKGRKMIENKFDEQIVIKKYVDHITKLIK